LPFRFLANTLFFIGDLCIVFDIVWGGTFTLFVFCLFSIPFHLL
jgi:hypothetical protein